MGTLHLALDDLQKQSQEAGTQSVEDLPAAMERLWKRRRGRLSQLEILIPRSKEQSVFVVSLHRAKEETLARRLH
jgi:hypothetical protein